MNVASTSDTTFVEAADAAGITYCHAALRDNSCVAEHEVKRLVQTVVAEVNSGNSVMIHCNQGCNRSALIAILSIINLTGCDPAEAIRRAREMRPSVLRNRFFERYVRAHGVRRE